jgi:chromosome segregation ATPase
MKPDILSKKRLKKIEDALQVERNKLELAINYRNKVMDQEQETGTKAIDKWDEDLEQLTTKLKSLRERTPGESDLRGMHTGLEEREERIRELETEVFNREGVLKELEKEKSRLELRQSEGEKLHETELERFQDLLAEKEGELKEISKSHRDLQAQLRESLLKGEEEAGNLKERIAELEGEISLREGRIKEKDDQISELSALVKLKEKDLSGLEKTRVKLLSESEKTSLVLQSENQRLNREIEDRENEIDRLTARLLDSEAKLSETVKVNRKDVEALKNRVS